MLQHYVHPFVTSVSMIFVLMTSLLWFISMTDASPVPRVELDKSWKSFKVAYNKQYSGTSLESFRRSVWEQNLDYITKHNNEAELGLHNYTLGINQFTDLTPDEYRKLILKTRIPSVMNDTASVLLDDVIRNRIVAPDTLDWRLNGSVTPVQNQGMCGSCWAFSAIGALEGQWYKKTGQLVKLSEQNLIDCSDTYDNSGCNGGWMEYAFNYIMNNKGINTDESYPYTGRNGACRFNSVAVGATCKGFISPSLGNEQSLKQAVAAVGPIAVAIDASQDSFQFYKSGVYNEPKCTQDVNHGVLIVGYGTFEGQDYWLVKNSWGTFWGEGGYIKMSRNNNNQCSIASNPIFPVV